MAINFPLTLQQQLNEEGFSFSIGSTTIRSSVDIGPAKIRRRFTKGVDTQSATIDIKYDLYQTLYDFYNISLSGGSLAFSYTDQFTGETEEYRFVGTPKFSPKGGEYFRVSMQWEKMP